MIPFSGCAAAYHDYSGSCIPYAYCLPRALPYVAYDDRHCPTPGASQYSQQQYGVSSDAVPDSGVPVEAPTASEQNGPPAPLPK